MKRRRSESTRTRQRNETVHETGQDQAISQADRVVFVGYRIPHTDSIARERITDAIRSAGKGLECHAVLGQSKPDEGRIAGLLQFALRGRKDMSRAVGAIHIQPLYAEDFFAVVKRDLL